VYGSPEVAGAWLTWQRRDDDGYGRAVCGNQPRRRGTEGGRPKPVGVDFPVVFLPAAVLLDDELLTAGITDPYNRVSQNRGNLAAPQDPLGGLKKDR
jgi:hypothetical protein